MGFVVKKNPSWRHEGDKKYHLKYDKEGNETKTLLKGRQLRPGDPE